MSIARLLASGLGVGYCPIAPGTVASVLALLPGAGLLWAGEGYLMLAAVAVALVGWWAARQAADDPGWIVIDEIAGQWIALLGLVGMAPSLPWLLAAFALFRLFDIVKPWPVSWMDRRHDALGVMGDDVIAGAMAAALLLGARGVWTG